MNLQQALIAAALLSPSLLSSAALAESAVATVDLAVELQATNLAPASGEQVEVVVTLNSFGAFGTDSSVVNIDIPAGLTLMSATPVEEFDASNGTWSVGELQFSDATSLTLTLMVDLKGQSVVTLIADLESFTTSFGAYDSNSTPGNDDPCEDDHAELRFEISDRVGAADAGVQCVVPDPIRPDARVRAVDGGVFTNDDVDAGLGSDGDSGCSASGQTPGTSALLLFGLLGLVLRPRIRRTR